MVVEWIVETPCFLAGLGLFVRFLQAMQMLMGCFRTEEAEKWLISLFGFPLICAIASRNLHCVPFCFLIAKLQMASVSHSCRKHFLVLYESYQKAKKKNGPVIWARAVLCREYLEKIADPDKEADIFEEMFAGEKPTESFRELCEDSKSYPWKLPRPPLPSQTISLPRVD